MTNEECFVAWAPDGSLWSQWAKPVVFAHIDRLATARAEDDEATMPGFAWPPDARPERLIIVDLPGERSVLVGLSLAGRGHRPVPLFNGNPHHLGVVDVEPIARRLRGGAKMMRTLAIRPDAPPAFLLDANRMAPIGGLRPGRFDNRWLVLPQDFPSATLLMAHGIRQALLLQSNTADPPEDLAHVLLRWQEAGIGLLRQNAEPGADTVEIHVAPPSRFRRSWHRAIALMGLRRSNVGGFGAIIPEPSSGIG